MNAGLTIPLTPDMILVKGDARTMRSGRPIELSPSAPTEPTPAVLTARKMVAACRHNVRFLGHRLRPYGRWLELPPVIDDVLYLAYSIAVKPSAPFSGSVLGRHLAAAGIETASAYTFVSPPEATAVSLRPAETATLCLPCHHTLSILDLQYMVETIASFFAARGLEADMAPTDDL